MRNGKYLGSRRGFAPVARLPSWRDIGEKRSRQAEVRCKRLLRPHQDIAKWSAQALHRKSWPARHAFAAPCPQRVPAVFQGHAPAFDLSLPAIVDGALDAWPDAPCWSLDALLDTYGATPFVIGAAWPDESGACEPVRMTLEDYVAYAHRQQDDDPLYLFDDGFLHATNALASSYARPPCIAEDLMDVMGAERVHNRGLLIGAARSGASMHVDALETSAWNTLVCGAKRWVMLPPRTFADELRDPSVDELEDDSFDSASIWLHSTYLSLALTGTGCIDFVQVPGETVYIPRGWWHCVVNLEFSIAVTENLVGRRDLLAAHRHFQRASPKFADRWAQALSVDADFSSLTIILSQTN